MPHSGLWLTEGEKCRGGKGRKEKGREGREGVCGVGHQRKHSEPAPDFIVKLISYMMAFPKRDNGSHSDFGPF